LKSLIPKIWVIKEAKAMKSTTDREKNPCIWTEAGVIDHLNCDINYECSTCSFGQAMANPADRTEIVRKVGLLAEGAKVIQESEKQREVLGHPTRPQLTEVFGFQVPVSSYLHRGHTWVSVETADRVRVGLDDFSQKILGPADDLKLPAVGKVYYQDHICMALLRQGKKASVLAPIDGTIEAVNPELRRKPSLIHDDPYGEGWLFLIHPSNLKNNLHNLLFGEANAEWIDAESHRLLNLMGTTVGVTLPDGGSVIDDVYGHYPKLGWRRLVQDFLLKKTWKTRY
jgi:glycine cleavage system H lipoate-binding protein